MIALLSLFLNNAQKVGGDGGFGNFAVMNPAKPNCLSIDSARRDLSGDGKMSKRIMSFPGW